MLITTIEEAWELGTDMYHCSTHLAVNYAMIRDVIIHIPSNPPNIYNDGASTPGKTERARRLGIIGGCEEYTGAPYFVAHAALVTGADLAHIICEQHAGTVIKSYSPDLIVHPYFQSYQNRNDASLEVIKERVAKVIPKLHAISVGSGLGNDKYMLKCAEIAIKEAKESNLPIVFDADSLSIIGNSPSIVRGYKSAILSPNSTEFEKLCKSLDIDANQNKTEAVKSISKALGGVTVVLKGATDIISNGEKVFYCDEKGGLRRCGGQGDVLSGTMATFLGWGRLYERNIWRHELELDPDEITMLAAFAGCLLTRHASRLAYESCGRQTQTSSILEFLPEAFESRFGGRADD
ncbi:hypothetical protein H4219_000841 [Mycoemilia scoparia]|uniref:ATP-dependent (S)-NAD(P)H-hydrate dehydratase n=1 Tax=Mycoemilia scoparia TaxID=417184 RepID=A0A9W8DWX2_9FUNG|nr:hypothetical protein H4219_000841 [Mycoemilia scoparia]